MSWLSWNISSMSWISEDEFDGLDKLDCRFDKLANLRMSSMSWISCTEISMSWLSCTVSWMSWLSLTVSSMSLLS